MSVSKKSAIRSFVIACAFAGVSSLAPIGSASALPLGAALAVTGETSSLEIFHQAQFRGRGRGRGGFRGGGRARGGFRGGRTFGGRSRLRRNNALGAAAAIGVGAALLGAIASGAANRRREVVEEPVYVRRRPGGDAVSYCIRRFRSYNPDTGLYRGFDGRMHPCP